jgi:flagellar basal body-associated protein FliL
MAEKAEKRPEERAPPPPSAAAHGAAEKKPAASMLKSTPIMLGAVMLLEAVVLFVGFKFIGAGAAPAHGANLETTEGGPGEAAPGAPGEGGAPAKADPKAKVELKVLEFKAPNKQNGRTFFYDVVIYLVAKGEFKEKIEQTITSRDAMIKDRIRTIIAQIDPEKLSGAEPGLETFRRQVKHQLEELIGEGLIEEVLVPRCIPYRTDF